MYHLWEPKNSYLLGDLILSFEVVILKIAIIQKQISIAYKQQTNALCNLSASMFQRI